MRWRTSVLPPRSDRSEFRAPKWAAGALLLAAPAPGSCGTVSSGLEANPSEPAESASPTPIAAPSLGVRPAPRYANGRAPLSRPHACDVATSPPLAAAAKLRLGMRCGSATARWPLSSDLIASCPTGRRLDGARSAARRRDLSRPRYPLPELEPEEHVEERVDDETLDRGRSDYDGVGRRHDDQPAHIDHDQERSRETG
jgi:hypothetical protein